MRPVSAILLAWCLAAISCGLVDDYPTGLGQGALPGDPLYPKPDPGPTGCVGPTDTGTSDVPDLEVADLSGMAWRFDSLALGRPLTEDLLPLVNQVVSDQVSQRQLNLLLVVDRDDRQTGTLHGRAGTAVPAQDAWALQGTPSEVLLALDRSRFQSAEDSSLSISVAIGTDTLTLPVQALRLSGTFSSDAATIGDGRLNGAITVEDAGKVSIPLYGTLQVLMETNEVPPDTTVGPDRKPAWSFEATFSAAKVLLAP
jgi:hypothetical protein